MGARVKWLDNGVFLSAEQLHAISADLSATPDIAPILACTAACAEGTSVLTGVARLRIKESDRLEATVNMLRAFGAQVSAGEDSIEIIGTRTLTGASVDGCGDHRMVMSAAVLACVCSGQTEISSAQSVSKSYPTFFEHFALLGGKSRMSKELTELRGNIDRIDEQMTRLVAERMDTASVIAQYKLEHGLPVLDASREEQVIARLREMSREDIRDDIEQLYRLMMRLSRERQQRLMENEQ